MGREQIERDLTQAEGHVRQGEQHILCQRELITDVERDGHDISEAQALLALFDETLCRHIEYRNRLTRDLDAL